MFNQCETLLILQLKESSLNEALLATFGQKKKGEERKWEKKKKTMGIYVCFSHLDLNECNLISNEICPMFGSPFLGKMGFDTDISYKMKLNK